MMKRNFYHILGIDSLSGSERIRDAYKEAVIRFHPDINHSPGSGEEFLSIQQAFEVLNDPIKKIEYDAQIESDAELFPVTVILKSSQKTIPPSQESQLLYCLFDVNCNVQPEQTVNSPMAIALVVDTSTSMAGDRLDSVKRCLLALIQQLNKDDYFCVIGFNDRAQVVVPLVQAEKFRPEEEQITRMATTGGTELYQGLHTAYSCLMAKEADHCRMHMVIFTDGNTYGDEADCLRLAKNAAEKKVVISAFGFGNEWNDVFLDRLTAITGGETRFVAKSNNLEQYFQIKLSSLGTLFSQSVKLSFSHRKDVKVNYAFRLKPDAAPIEIADEMVLGNVPFKGKLTVILELILPVMDMTQKNLRLGQGFVTIESPFWDSQIRSFFNYKIDISTQERDERPIAEIANALAVLTMYRIQDRARQDVADGKSDLAVAKLDYLIKHLKGLGHFAFAQEVEKERESIVRIGKYSNSGDKTIKYGTRALLLPEN